MTKLIETKLIKRTFKAFFLQKKITIFFGVTTAGYENPKHKVGTSEGFPDIYSYILYLIKLATDHILELKVENLKLISPII